MNLAAPLLLLAAAGTAPADPSLQGRWTVNGAQLELSQDGDTLIGKLAATGGPCPVPVGTELIRGTLLDDSLAAQVRLCLLSASCGADPAMAPAVLLVAAQLTGGVHASAPCAAEARALTLRHPNDSARVVAPPAGQRLARSPPPTSAERERARLAAALRASEHPKRSAPAAASETSSTSSAASSIRARAAVSPMAIASTQPAGRIPEPGPIAERPVGDRRGDGGEYDPRDARDAPPPARIHEATEAALQKGFAELQSGQFEAARKSFHEALAHDPARVEAYNGVGVTFYARGDLEEAAAWYKRALEVDPRFGDAFYNLACTYALRGKKELAMRYLRLAALNHYAEREQLEQDPDSASLRGEPEMAALLNLLAPASP